MRLETSDIVLKTTEKVIVFYMYFNKWIFTNVCWKLLKCHEIQKYCFFV